MLTIFYLKLASSLVKLRSPMAIRRLLVGCLQRFLMKEDQGKGWFTYGEAC